MVDDDDPEGRRVTKIQREDLEHCVTLNGRKEALKYEEGITHLIHNYIW